MQIEGRTAGIVWEALLAKLLNFGDHVNPRGLGNHEIVNVTLYIYRALNNIIISESRKLNYKFMVAEWLWIISGSNEVSPLSVYNKKMLDFSDDGRTLFGAYGPPIKSQLNYVTNKLNEDHDTRQAVISIWRPNPQPSKDIPCTLTFQFLIRRGHLNTIVNMRSSDAWLGLPYDIFNFSMVANIVSETVNFPLGSIMINLGSSHLYDINFDAAQEVLRNPIGSAGSPQFLVKPPSLLFWAFLRNSMHAFDLEEEPWATYKRVLTAPTITEAKNILITQRKLI